MADRACVALLRQGEVLMVRQTYRGAMIWTFPGGGIVGNETPAAAAIREVNEETGLDVAIVALLTKRSRVGGKGMYYCYLGTIIAGEAVLGSDPELPLFAQELHEVRWFPLASVRIHPEIDPIWHRLVAVV